MIGQESDQTPDRDELLALHVASGETVTKAARLAGMSRSTAKRRLQDRDFRQRVREARSELLEESAAALAGASREAVVCLRSLLTAEGEGVRLGAAKAILETSIRYRDAIELESRIAALEEQIRGNHADS